jgi:CBS domain-containing protein
MRRDASRKPEQIRCRLVGSAGLQQENQVKVSEIMTRDVQLADPQASIQEIAATMARIDAGFMPVAENDRLVGTITDRDIAIRAVAEGRGPDTRVADIMSKDVKYCFEDEDLAEIARNMASLQVRRLPVVDRDKRLVGVVSLGDIAVEDSSIGNAEVALSGISEPRQLH